MRKYRIERKCHWYYATNENNRNSYRHVPTYYVQMKWLCFWITIKTFFDMFSPDIARKEAEELLNNLNK